MWEYKYTVLFAATTVVLSLLIPLLWSEESRVQTWFLPVLISLLFIWTLFAGFGATVVWNSYGNVCQQHWILAVVLTALVTVGCSILSATPGVLWLPIASEAGVLLSYMFRRPLGSILELLNAGLRLLEQGITIVKDALMLGHYETPPDPPPDMPVGRPRPL